MGRAGHSRAEHVGGEGAVRRGAHQPFENGAENALQTFAQGAIFLTLALGGMMQTGASDTAGATHETAHIDEDAASAVIILINASVFAAIIALAWLNRPRDVIETIKRRASSQLTAATPGPTDTTNTATGAAAAQSSRATTRPGSSAANAGKQQAWKPPTQPSAKEAAFAPADDTDDEAEGFGFGDDGASAPGGFIGVGAGAEADEVVGGEAPGANCQLAHNTVPIQLQLIMNWNQRCAGRLGNGTSGFHPQTQSLASDTFTGEDQAGSASTEHQHATK